MPPARSFIGRLGIAAACCCLTTGVAVASEVLDILGDIEKDFRASHQQLVDYQSRIDQVQLGARLDKGPPSASRVAADLQVIGGGSARTMQSLRSKVDKVDELRASLQERFPEDGEQIRRYFERLAGLLSSSEVLYKSLREELEQARTQLVTTVESQADPRRREQLLATVRERMAQHDRAPVAGQPDEVADPTLAAFEEPSAPVAARARATAELAHPPVKLRSPARRRPAPAAGSVTVDLEQLIQEMEK